MNGTLHARQAAVWDEGTTACASDSKHFGARDQNLRTKWHVRYGGPVVMVYFCRLLGSELLPRLKALATQRLYRPAAGKREALWQCGGKREDDGLAEGAHASALGLLFSPAGDPLCYDSHAPFCREASR